MPRWGPLGAPNMIFLFTCLWIGLRLAQGSASASAIDGDAAVARPVVDTIEEADREVLLIDKAQRTALAPTQFVHIYDWQLQRWVTFWPPGMAPPQILNNSDEWQLGLDDDSFALERPNSDLLLPPAAFTAPSSSGAEWIAVPNLLHSNPSLYRTTGSRGESLWFVLFGALRSNIPHDADPDAALWTLVSEHQSTVVRAIHQLTFATVGEEAHAVSSCTLELRTGSWDCGAGFPEPHTEDPPPCLAMECSHAALVVGDGMEWMDTEGAALRFVVGDHVWGMRVDHTTEAGSTVVFQMQSSALLPAPLAPLAAPGALLPPPSAVGGPEAVDVPSSRPPAPWWESFRPTLPRLKWCTTTASICLFIVVVLHVVKRAWKIKIKVKTGSKHHKCGQLPLSRDPTPPNVAKEPNTGLWCVSGRVLGRGAYGVVYQGLDPLTGGMVAIKQLAISKASEVEREVRLLSILKHPNIVSYLGCYCTGTSLHLVMEYVPCGSLESLMQTYKFVALPALRMYTMDILHGLSYLHGHGIIHRDIKPANILIGQDGMCKLADFGLSRAPCEDVNIYRSLTATDVARTIPMGTPAYMSPEAIQGTPCMPSDVWAVGMTLAELASGQKPWHHLKVTQPMALLVAIVRESEMGCRLPKWLPPAFATFVRRCLVASANLRATAEQLLCDTWIVQPNPEEAQIIPDWIAQQAPEHQPCVLSPQTAAQCAAAAAVAPTPSFGLSDTHSDWLSSSTTMSQTISLRPEQSLSSSDAPRESWGASPSMYSTLGPAIPYAMELKPLTKPKMPEWSGRSSGSFSSGTYQCGRKRSSSMPSKKNECPMKGKGIH